MDQVLILLWIHQHISITKDNKYAESIHITPLTFREEGKYAGKKYWNAPWLVFLCLDVVETGQQMKRTDQMAKQANQPVMIKLNMPVIKHNNQHQQQATTRQNLGCSGRGTIWAPELGGGGCIVNSVASEDTGKTKQNIKQMHQLHHRKWDRRIDVEWKNWACF